MSSNTHKNKKDKGARTQINKKSSKLALRSHKTARMHCCSVLECWCAPKVLGVLVGCAQGVLLQPQESYKPWPPSSGSCKNIVSTGTLDRVCVPQVWDLIGAFPQMGGTGPPVTSASHWHQRESLEKQSGAYRTVNNSGPVNFKIKFPRVYCSRTKTIIYTLDWSSVLAYVAPKYKPPTDRSGEAQTSTTLDILRQSCPNLFGCLWQVPYDLDKHNQHLIQLTKCGEHTFSFLFLHSLQMAQLKPKKGFFSLQKRLKPRHKYQKHCNEPMQHI